MPHTVCKYVFNIALESQGMGIGSLTGETRDTWHEVQTLGVIKNL